MRLVIGWLWLRIIGCFTFSSRTEFCIRPPTRIKFDASKNGTREIYLDDILTIPELVLMDFNSSWNNSTCAALRRSIHALSISMVDNVPRNLMLVLRALFTNRSMNDIRRISVVQDEHFENMSLVNMTSETLAVIGDFFLSFCMSIESLNADVFIL